MEKNVKSIWIESEEKGAIIGGNELNDNSDVIVTLNDGRRFVANFFSYENIDCLRKQNNQTGECLSGKYFWAINMVLIDAINREGIEQVVDYLIHGQEFNKIFKRI